MSKSQKKHILIVQGVVLAFLITAASLLVTTKQTAYVKQTIPEGKGICQAIWTASNKADGMPVDGTARGLPIPYVVDRPASITCDLGTGTIKTVSDVTFKKLFVDLAFWMMVSVAILVSVQAAVKSRKGHNK